MEAVKTLKAAPALEPLEDAVEVAKRSLVDELMNAEVDKVVVMTAYYEYKRWKKQANDRKAAILLLL